MRYGEEHDHRSQVHGSSYFSSGLGWTFWLVVVGRVITGVAGAGMTVLVSILITGLYLLDFEHSGTG